MLVVVASLFVYRCALRKNEIVASQSYDLAGVQFTAEYSE